MTGHATDGKLEFDPRSLDSLSVYKLMAGSIVPRPIGFISTLGSDGIFNAAPFSFFNMVSHMPPLVSVSIARNKPAGPTKDTLANIMASGEFVINVVSKEIVAAVDQCSHSYPADVDEIEISGLTPCASSTVRPPCILESPVSFECRLAGQGVLPDSIHCLVIGSIVRIHVRSDLLTSEFRIDQSRLAAVGRMAGNTYCHTGDMFTLAHDGFAAVPRQTVAHADGGLSNHALAAASESKKLP
jgi:flavin reductase (DIM6/NTAB) family NADH-FMN oxidoreductase RutF